MPPGYDGHKNYSYSTVATAPSPATSGTSLVVTAGHGVRFPTAPFAATVWPAGVQPKPANAEIVLVTAVATDTFTITRAQESSSARTIVVGDQIIAKAVRTIGAGGGATGATGPTGPTGVTGVTGAPPAVSYKFSVYRNAATTAGNATPAVVVFDTELFDTGSNHSTSTGVFTAPVAGFYWFSATVNFVASAATYKFIGIFKNGAEIARVAFAGGTEMGISVSKLVQLAATDTVDIRAFSVGEALQVGAIWTWFTGFLVSTT